MQDLLDKSELTIGADPHHSRADARLIARAARRRWNVSDRAAENLPLVMESIAYDNNAKRRERTAAARAVIAMMGQNQTDELNAEKLARIDAGKATESVDIRVESREMAKRIAADPELCRQADALIAHAAGCLEQLPPMDEHFTKRVSNTAKRKKKRRH